MGRNNNDKKKNEQADKKVFNKNKNAAKAADDNTATEAKETQKAQEQVTADKAAAPELDTAALTTQLTQAEDKYLRAKADMENYRRRVQREMMDLRNQARTETLEQILGVFDHFQMALQHAQDKADMESLRQGMTLIFNEFEKVLENLGVTRFSSIGEAFDPNLHEAVSQEPSDEMPAGKVLREWKCGYRLGDRLLRPATVVVSAGKTS